MTLASEIIARRFRLPAPQTRDVTVERDLVVPMDDGVELLADRLVPVGVPNPPTLLVRSPYGRRGWVALMFGRLYAERGFQVVIQSVRGTFGSGGDFSPFDERPDGRATIEWLRRQPWHTGKLGTVGPSYMGLTQWALARDADGALNALAAQTTASQFHSPSYNEGAIALESTLTWVLLVGVQERRFAPLRALLGLRRTLPTLYDRLPVGELDESAVGSRLPWYREWFEHTSADDPYWAARDFSAGVAEVTAPVQLISGWYDIFLPWLLEDYRALRGAGREAQLIVGPWTHTAPGLAANSARESLGWLRAHLVGDRRRLRTAPVRIYVTGAREWREFEDWPPADAQTNRLYLQREGGLSGREPEPSAPDAFAYDPHDPTPSVGGPTLLARRPVVDNRALESRDDVLTYTSAPLERRLEVIGPVTAEIHVRSTLPHFDVFCRVCDVLPSGVSLNVCDALTRFDPETSERSEDGVVKARLDLWPTAHRFDRGHRLRVQISSGAHPRYARNPGTGEPVATATRLERGLREVFHDPAHPSHVTLAVRDGGG
jgi:uncharacterized protein